MGSSINDIWGENVKTLEVLGQMMGVLYWPQVRSTRTWKNGLKKYMLLGEDMWVSESRHKISPYFQIPLAWGLGNRPQLQSALRWLTSSSSTYSWAPQFHIIGSRGARARTPQEHMYYKLLFFIFCCWSAAAVLLLVLDLSNSWTLSSSKGGQLGVMRCVCYEILR